ncbi:tautomerase family protein [Gordonia polyisoprenivorans]|uniref:tautomerase family protein n=1 Tax=Gordonia polyisoprenivorans TaxID=84595 RepID=UPI001AD65489|nr:tautomerase family protein [Gordonia polyisoprenivorans]QTI71291.1 tautomerase family protein [Gordonia polyisoprenivorans]
MPFWTIYTPEGIFSETQKKALASEVTDGYAQYGGMPRFYVVVIFKEVPSGSFYVGGEPVHNFVRIVIDHIARATPVDARPIVMQLFETQLAPHIKDRGLDWELHIDETPIDLWRVHGLPAPPFGSAAEKQWVRDNAPSPYEGLKEPELTPEAMAGLAAINPDLAAESAQQN